MGRCTWEDVGGPSQSPSTVVGIIGIARAINPIFTFKYLSTAYPCQRYMFAQSIAKDCIQNVVVVVIQSL